MIDAETLVYKRVAEKFSEIYPTGSRYGEPVDKPARFPCMTIWEADNSTYMNSLDSEMTEHHATLMYEVNVYSNKISGAKQEAKAIMALIDAQMLEMGFTRTFCNPMKNQETKIYRITARYTGVIDENYRIYRR